MPLDAQIFFADSRSMHELDDESVGLVVTSPPYWSIKDYGDRNQIGHGQTLHGYLVDLYQVWEECYRILFDGSRLCVNIGDQFARKSVYGRYKVIPLHAEIIAQAEMIGFDFLGSIIWQKKTTMNTTGGATIMGSYPHPPNGIVEIDYEYIHIFKKPGKPRTIDAETNEASRLTKEQWKTFFQGHWSFGGARQKDHAAMFPPELPRRLIRMFSFTGDLVVDPFLGSGTTMQVALQLGRRAAGYEINADFEELIKQRLDLDAVSPTMFPPSIRCVHREQTPTLETPGYSPRIRNATPSAASQQQRTGNGANSSNLHRIEAATRDGLQLDSGREVKFLGVRISDEHRFRQYVDQYLVGKRITLECVRDDCAYVRLKNRIFVNRYLVQSGIGEAIENIDHPRRDAICNLSQKRNQDDEAMGAQYGNEPVGSQQKAERRSHLGMDS